MIALASTLSPPVIRYAPPPIVKSCACCGRTFTASSWLSLKYVGQQDDGEGGWLNLRNCPCGSTLAVESER